MPTSSRFRILCVDDESSGLNLRKLILERKGYEVAAAATVPEALALFRSTDFDLVVSDHLLGRETGTGMAKEMKRLKPHVPILVLSGVVETPEGVDAIDGFISKASAIESLLVKIDEVLSRTPATVDSVPTPNELQPAESHRLLAAIVESSDDAILSKTLEGTILTWNEAAERIYGYGPEEVIGRNVSILLPPDRPDEERKLLDQLKRGEKIEHFETVRVAKDGHLLTLSITISPVRDSDGRVIAASTIARDITQSKLAEESLRNSEKLAVAGRMAATIAHEINNPLEAVANALYLLVDSSSLNVSEREFLSTAREELAKARKIVTLTLGQYRGDTDVPQQVKVSELIENVLSLYGRKLRTIGVAVETNFDTDLPVTAFAGELRQVFSNLIINAADALETSGDKLRIHVFASRDRKNPETTGVRVTIADNGCGIPASKRAHLFQPFFTTKGSKGTGIGMWVSQNIAKKYGGTIRFRSSDDPGRSGTTFQVFLPATQAA